MAGEFKDKSKENLDDGADILSPIFKRIGEQAKEAAGEVGNAFKDGFEKGSGTFDSQSVKDKAVDAMMPVAGAMADVMAGAPARRKIADAAKKLVEPFEKTAEDAANAADRANAAAQTSRAFGEAARPSGRAPGKAGAVFGGDNVFAKDRARLGLASGLSSGGLGETRKLGSLREEQKKKQQDYAKTQVEILEDIDKNISAALTVA
jgi:hypothetical protein